MYFFLHNEFFFAPGNNKNLLKFIDASYDNDKFLEYLA